MLYLNSGKGAATGMLSNMSAIDMPQIVFHSANYRQPVVTSSVYQIDSVPDFLTRYAYDAIGCANECPELRVRA